MKRVLFSCTLVLCLLGFVAIGVSDTSGPNPDNQLAQIDALYTQFCIDVNDVYNTYTPDYHPYYGYVGINDMPVHSSGWDDQYIHEVFPGETVQSFTKELVYLSGRVLMQHKDSYGTKFYVWHEIQNEPMYYFRAQVYGHWVDLWGLVRPACANNIGLYVDGVFVGYVKHVYIVRF
jgi:hypothetical protein